MNIVPNDSKYVPLTQQKWCCVPTCFQIVMLRHKIPLLPAEQLGYYMGLVVPKSDLNFFWSGRTGKRPPAGYGTKASTSKHNPNKVFKKFNIPLKVDWKLISNFKTTDEFKKYLAEFEKTNKDILICYDWGKLFNKPNYQGGHVCVLDKVDIKNSEIRFVDPDQNAPKWQTVKINKLYEAMKFHGDDKSAGFWEITKI